MFFTFSQNNSGGRFISDRQKGIAQFVAIEATSEENAIEKAESILDFKDNCECCGHRWSYTSLEVSDLPSYYGEEISKLGRFGTPFVGAIHYLEGTIEIVPGIKGD